jgi:hypothetical protein
VVAPADSPRVELTNFVEVAPRPLHGVEPSAVCDVEDGDGYAAIDCLGGRPRPRLVGMMTP